jgi:hypothetical protein
LAPRAKAAQRKKAMTIHDAIARWRMHRRDRRARSETVRQMDALTEPLQRDIGWTSDSPARAFAVYQGP